MRKRTEAFIGIIFIIVGLALIMGALYAGSGIVFVGIGVGMLIMRCTVKTND